MEIIIDDNSRLCEIQKEFSKHFPYLKLEFFGFQPSEKKIFIKENLITDTNKTLEKVRHVHRPGHISINGHQKVSTLEKHFKDQFGMYVQVFRKSGNIWLQTTTSDDWTLTEQNDRAAEINKQRKEKVVEGTEDYHEQL